MKAIQYRTFGSREVLEYVDLPEPEPRAGEALIETTAIGVNFPDIRERLGFYNRAETRVGGVTLPQVGGLQVVGRVVRTGAETDAHLIGRKVVALMSKGAYAQQTVARVDLLLELYDDADDIAMASVPCQGVTAFLSLQVCTVLRPGESLLVHGAAGGVGSLAVQIAKILGASTVIGTASSEARRAFVLGIGADLAISYNSPQWPEAVLAHTDGKGVDVILETIGGDVFDQNFACLGMLGRCVVIGLTRGPGEPLAPRRLMAKAQTLTGVYLPAFFHRPDLIQRGLRFLKDGIEDGQIRPNVAATLPLSRTAGAHTMLERREAQGVINLDPRH